MKKGWIAVGCIFCWMDVTAMEEMTINIYPEHVPNEMWGNGQKKSHISQSVATISQSDIRQTGSDRVEDVADSIPGVQIGRFQAGIGSDLYLRGFPLGGQFFLDGLQDKVGYFVRDPATIKRLEVYKGADSVLFGSASPGGVVNYVTNKPSFKTGKTLSLETGVPQRTRLVFDTTGALKPESDWAYRTILVHQQARTGQENVGDDRFTLFPSLRYLTEQDDLLLEAEFNRQEREYDFDHVFVNGEPVYNVSYVDPRTEAKRDSLRLSTHYERLLENGWASRLAANWIGMDRYDRIAGFYYLAADDKPLPGYYRVINEDSTQYHLKAELEKEWKLGAVKHKTRMGLEKRKIDSAIVSGSCANCFQLDIFNPIFDYPLPTDDQLKPNNYRTVSGEQALFLHHTLERGDTSLTVGLRHTQLTGSVTNSDSGVQSGEVDTQDNLFSLGVTHSLNPDWQVFASRNASLLPNAGHDRESRPLPPRQGVQHELGLRYQKKTGRGNAVKASVSAYQIEQDNLTVRDPVDRSARMISGSARVRGAEASLKLPVTPKLGMEVAYNYSNAKLTQKDMTTDLHNIPEHQVSLKLDYQPTERTTLFLGATHVGKRPGDDANSFSVPAYTRLDAGLEHKINRKTSLNLGVRNLLNADYVASSEAVDFIVQGRKRTVTVGLELEF